MKQLSIRQMLAGALLAAACMILAANLCSTNQARAEVSGSPERPTFQSGGQNSIPVLREIAGTLRQIDARLARLETVAQKMQSRPVEEAAAVTDEAN